MGINGGQLDPPAADGDRRQRRRPSRLRRCRERQDRRPDRADHRPHPRPGTPGGRQPFPRRHLHPGGRRRDEKPHPRPPPGRTGEKPRRQLPPAAVGPPLPGEDLHDGRLFPFPRPGELPLPRPAAEPAGGRRRNAHPDDKRHPESPLGGAVPDGRPGGKSRFRRPHRLFRGGERRGPLPGDPRSLWKTPVDPLPGTMALPAAGTLSAGGHPAGRDGLGESPAGRGPVAYPHRLPDAGRGGFPGGIGGRLQRQGPFCPSGRGGSPPAVFLL